MLLGVKRSLRLTKLEKRSPATAKTAIRLPICHPRPISAAQMDVPNKDATTPRIVFEGPNRGCPSTKVAPPSSGRPNVPPRAFLARTAVPLATISRISSCSTDQPCINRASYRASESKCVHAKEKLLKLHRKATAGHLQASSTCCTPKDLKEKSRPPLASQSTDFLTGQTA